MKRCCANGRVCAVGSRRTARVAGSICDSSRRASAWDTSGREEDELLRGATLASALDWSADHVPELNQLERAFLESSRRASELEAERQRSANRRLRGLLTGVARVPRDRPGGWKRGPGAAIARTIRQPGSDGPAPRGPSAPAGRPRSFAPPRAAGRRAVRLTGDGPERGARQQPRSHKGRSPPARPPHLGGALRTMDRFSRWAVSDGRAPSWIRRAIAPSQRCLGQPWEFSSDGEYS